MKRYQAILFIVLIVGLMVFAATRQKESRAPLTDGDVKGLLAPKFTLKDIDGKKVSLDDYKGKVVVVNFWATWCPPCRVEIPWFVDLQQQYGADGVQIIGVSMDDDEDPTEVANFARKMKMNYPVLIGNNEVAKQYGGVEALPTTFFIDREGKVVQRSAGLHNRREIEDAVKSAMTARAELQSQAAPPHTIAQDSPEQK